MKKIMNYLFVVLIGGLMLVACQKEKVNPVNIHALDGNWTVPVMVVSPPLNYYKVDNDWTAETGLKDFTIYSDSHSELIGVTVATDEGIYKIKFDVPLVENSISFEYEYQNEPYSAKISLLDDNHASLIIGDWNYKLTKVPSVFPGIR